MSELDLGRLGVWCHLDSLPIAAARRFATQADRLGYDALWVAETVGREPFTLLGLLAGEPRRLRLGTAIVSIWGHDAQTTRMAAETLNEATGGRFVLGLGVSHQHLAERLRGHAYERPLTQLRAFLAAYRQAVYKGPAARPGPPLLLAALRERMLELAATEADGAFPYLVTPERVAWIRGRLDAGAPDGRRPCLAVTLPVALAAGAGAGRAAGRGYLAPYLRPPNYQASWRQQGFDEADWTAPGSDRLVDAMVTWGSPQTIRSRLAELRDAGANHVALIPLDARGLTDDLAPLEALAGA